MKMEWDFDDIPKESEKITNGLTTFFYFKFTSYVNTYNYSGLQVNFLMIKSLKYYLRVYICSIVFWLISCFSLTLDPTVAATPRALTSLFSLVFQFLLFQFCHNQSFFQGFNALDAWNLMLGELMLINFMVAMLSNQISQFDWKRSQDLSLFAFIFDVVFFILWVAIYFLLFVLQWLSVSLLK